jgi:DGQHR domain-containing protein
MKRTLQKKRKKRSETIAVRALRTRQGSGVNVFSFFIKGSEIARVAEISRISRDDDDALKGFQRKEIQNHVKGIVEYLDRGDVLFPNAIILALSPEVEFKQSRGPTPEGVADVAQIGTLSIPIREEGHRVAWIVDGQQRSLALSRTRNTGIAVPVVAFISGDIETQREQFILVNKARPLPVRLINELLPEIGVQLPRDLSLRKIPSQLCNLLNRDSKSPFFELIRRMSQEELKSAVIIDTALVKVMRNSINNPLGALALYKDAGSGQSDIDGMYRTMFTFWHAVRDVFPEAWGKSPTKSRLMHSAGIQAMGILMDRIMTRLHNQTDPRNEVQQSLRRLRSHCHWTEGEWDGLSLKWNEVQNVPKHIRGLSDLLVRLDFNLSQKAA